MKMNLKDWENNRWLRRHKTSRDEVRNLLAIVDRDLKDAAHGISSDWRFGIAYNAALKLCTIVLFGEGYRAAQAGQHYYTIQAMPLILGEEQLETAAYLDACRKRRNIVEYESVGGISEDDVDELCSFVKAFKETVLTWLKKHHPGLLK